VIILSFNGFSPKDIVVPQFPFRPDFGFGLVVVYLVWMLVILIMYPLCKKYNEYKNSHRQWWLSYL
ncbi:MAG TPA: hypothetical protein VFV08_11635, partial [Puia sp.]|nr:hypothetical protein [Puia sp.]